MKSIPRIGNNKANCAASEDMRWQHVWTLGSKSRTGQLHRPARESLQGTWLGHVRGWILKCVQSLPNKLKKICFFFLLESFLKKYQLESPNRLTHPELPFSFLRGSQDCSSLLYWTQNRTGTACQDLELTVSRAPAEWRGLPSLLLLSNQRRLNHCLHSNQWDTREGASSFSKTACHKMLKLQLESLLK